MVKPWEPDLIATERFVLFRVEGVPLHVWDIDIFQFISSYLVDTLRYTIQHSRSLSLMLVEF